MRRALKTHDPAPQRPQPSGGPGRFDWLTAPSLKAAHAFRIVRETGQSVLDGFSRGPAQSCLGAITIAPLAARPPSEPTSHTAGPTGGPVVEEFVPNVRERSMSALRISYRFLGRIPRRAKASHSGF